MIGIIGAMNIEVEALRESMTDLISEKVGNIVFSRGRIFGKEVVTAVCGEGKVASAVCTEAMILKYSPDVIINTGVGGALNSKLRVGDIVIAEKLVQHDFDISPLGYDKGYIPELKGIFMESDKRVCDIIESSAKEAGFPYMRGKVATGDKFISSKADKASIVGAFGADVCEMEGGSIAQVCTSWHIPFCVLRAISDNADGDAKVSFNEFVNDAAKKAIFVLKGFIHEY